MAQIPTLDELPEQPRQIILHWTGGSIDPSDHDLKHYHYLIDGWGDVHAGVPVIQNIRQLQRGDDYAAHTKGFNSYSVGVAWCGMRGAKEGGPYGPDPITRNQTYQGCAFVRSLVDAWSIPVHTSTVFTHWEAEALHGREQRGKWDISEIPWLPNLPKSKAGDYLRLLVQGSAPYGGPRDTLSMDTRPTA